MRTFLAVLLLLPAVPARASAPQGAAAAFAVAYGEAAYSITTDANATAERVTVRRLGLDGGVLWEQRYGSGRNETPVGAAVTSGGGVSVAGDQDGSCFATHWGANGARKWENALTFGSECHVRAVLVDANADTYVLATTTVNEKFTPTVWKIDKTGRVVWYYSFSSAQPRYAFALTLDAAGDGVTTTTATNAPTGWIYENFDLDSNGRTR